VSAFRFEKFDDVAQRLAERADDIGYLVLFDRTERPEDKLGRFNWVEDDSIQAPQEYSSDEEGLFDAFEDEEDEEDEDSLVTALPGLVGQAVSWLRTMALDNFIPPWRRYRVRVYGPKGHSSLDSFQFIVRGEQPPEVEEDTPPWPQTPPLSFEAASERMGVGVLEHLGRGYARFIHLVLTTTNQLQQINAATNHQLHRQLVDTRGQNDRLVAAIIEQQGEMLQVERQGLDNQKSQAQMQLGQQALRTLDDATRLYLMTHKGLPPELQPLVSAVTSNPQLMQVLSNPQVQQLLGDPQAQQQLAAMLQMAAQQATAQAAPPSAPPDPTPTAG
jgi:hypothetical protein